MRAFLGVPIPTSPSLHAFLEDLRGTQADLKLVQEDQFHLTVRFLGDIPDADAQRIEEALRRAAYPKPFPILLQDVGAFPDWKKLNVLWVGVQDPTAGFTRMYVETHSQLAQLGFSPEDRGFSPHLTIARKRTDRGRDEARRVLERWRGKEFGGATVDTVRLYKSTLTRGGPVYEVVGAIPL